MGARTTSTSISMSPASVCTRTCGSGRGCCPDSECPGSTAHKRIAMASCVSISETIRQSQLELPAGKDVGTPKVFPEVHVLDDTDVAIGNEIRIVERVKSVASEFELVILQVKGARHSEIEVCNELATFGISGPRAADLTSP